jgi:putative endonuclease
MSSYMYILECADRTFHVGSTMYLKKRVWEHENLIGAMFTKEKHPAKLVYYETFSSIEDAYKREKQVDAWSLTRKKALIESKKVTLPLDSITFGKDGISAPGEG